LYVQSTCRELVIVPPSFPDDELDLTPAGIGYHDATDLHIDPDMVRQL